MVHSCCCLKIPVISNGFKRISRSDLEHTGLPLLSGLVAMPCKNICGEDQLAPVRKRTGKSPSSTTTSRMIYVDELFDGMISLILNFRSFCDCTGHKDFLTLWPFFLGPSEI